MPNESPKQHGCALKQLEFEMALELGLPGEDLVEAVRRATIAAGGEVLLVLPGAQGAASTVVRFHDDEGEIVLQVDQGENGLRVVAGDGIDEAVLRLARAASELTERLKGDAGIVEPSASEAG